MGDTLNDQPVEEKDSGETGKKEADAEKAAKARVTTMRVSDAQFEALDITPKLAKVPADALGLFIMNSDDPVLIKGAQRVTLGRHVEGGTPVSIDLTDYGAALLGVSRQHAAILISQDMYLLQDLGSTNGTWLNEVRLPPHIPRTLKNGDMIRLGQIRLYVVFHSVKANHDPDTAKTATINKNNLLHDSVILLEPDVRVAVTSVSKLTPHYLTADIAPYLEAIEQMQHVIDSIRGHKLRGLHIQAIKQGPPISVKLEGAPETIHLLRTIVGAWRSQHAATLSKVAHIIAESRELSTNAELEQSLREAQTELAQEILAQIAGGMTEPEREPYVKQLLGPLDVVTTSPLKVAAEL
ncbi:MAG: FHA domain-containing protein [Anaerolineae bacterium]|nr:FHA domain-containing protein [Anaerolineae bacterium]